jgi:hypothetical protein
VHRAALVAPVDLDRVDPDPVHPVRVVTVPADRAGQADPVITAQADRAGQADPVITAQADRVDQADPGCTDPADLAVPVAPAPGCTDLAVQAARGMATTSAATSTAPRGVMDPHPGDRVHHRGRTGTDRSHRLVGHGTTAQSTTGATTKTPSGISNSTNGASTSSESGSRCKESPNTTPASPIGEAGVVLIRLTAYQQPLAREQRNGVLR